MKTKEFPEYTTRKHVIENSNVGDIVIIKSWYPYFSPTFKRTKCGLKRIKQ